MDMDNADLTQYEALDRQCEQRSQSMKRMIAQLTPQFVMAHGNEIVQSWKDLKALTIQSNNYLCQLRMRYEHDAEKFEKLLRGAERRLDRQLDDLSEMRRAIVMMPASSTNPDVLRQQKAILEAIGMAQDSFNHEIDRLYDL